MSQRHRPANDASERDDELSIVSEAEEASSEDGVVAETQTHRIRVWRRRVGRRLDKYLHHRYPRISRTTLQKYIKQGLVTVNSLPTKASYEPAEGDLVELILPPPPPNELEPVDIPLDVLFEDEWLLVINKQAGIVCHPAYAGQTDTIANAAVFHAKRLSTGSDPFRPGILHRLDKNTTGVMAIAKTDEAHWRLSLQFERRTVTKEYVAICHGEIPRDTGVINRPLAPTPSTMFEAPTVGSPPRQAMYKEAITEYKVVKRYRDFSTVALFPKTGRTHQLRVHLMMLGFPIVGDEKYGGRSVSELSIAGSGDATPILLHQALHARRLRVVHPITEKPLEIEAPLPSNLSHILRLLEEHRGL